MNDLQVKGDDSYKEALNAVSVELGRVEKKMESLLNTLTNLRIRHPEVTPKIQNMLLDHISSYMRAEVRLSGVKEAILAKHLADALPEMCCIELEKENHGKHTKKNK